SITKSARTSVVIECTIEGRSMADQYVHWYRRKEDSKNLEWILYYQTPSNYKNGQDFQNGFSAIKTKDANNCILVLRYPSEKDSGTYFCADSTDTLH
uniref:Ig-like domain-containing protein n=1 Tax=Leptobrachium leishanense TaxID=445787 RepID=A0A8C5Q367_9ANUR